MKVRILIEETIRYQSEWTAAQIEAAYLAMVGAFGLHDIRQAYPDEEKRLPEMVEQLRDAGWEPFVTEVERYADIQSQTWMTTVWPDDEEVQRGDAA